MVKVKFTMDRQMDRQDDSYIPPKLSLQGYKNKMKRTKKHVME